MKIFPSKADFIVFETGYTSRVLEEDTERLEGDELKYFGNILDKLWREEGQPDYLPNNNKDILEIIKKKVNVRGALVFSNEGNQIYPWHLRHLIENINEEIDYCNFFQWDSLYEMEVKKIKINDEWKTILRLEFDTESG